MLDPGFSGFGASTEFIIYLVKLLCSLAPLTKLEVFYIFSLFSFIGVLLFYSMALRVTKHKDLLFLILLLPSLHWWTAGIGKEAVMVTCIITITYLTYYEKYFNPWLLGCVVIALIIRPHIAFLLLASFCFIYFFMGKNISILKRLVVIIAILFSLIASTPILLKRLSIESLDLETIEQRVELQASRNDHGGSSIDIGSYSIPERLFLYMFRPLFFDANGILGLIVSIENLVLLAFFCKMLKNYFNVRVYVKEFNPHTLFIILSVMIIWFLLGYTTANLGLAVRQKTQITPLLIYLYLLSEHTVICYKKNKGRNFENLRNY
jgi:hypothetical protein